MTECYRSLALGGNILLVVFIRYNAETYNVDTKIRKTTQEVLEVALLALINYVKLEAVQGLCVAMCTMMPIKTSLVYSKIQSKSLPYV